jgi:hypothetical protein
MEQQPMGLSSAVAAVTPLDIEQRLKKLRQSFEEIGGQPGDMMAVGLLLADVCDALGLTDAARFGVLGWSGFSYLTQWGDQAISLRVEDIDDEGTAEDSALATN